jgi:hypothetical protein
MPPIRSSPLNVPFSSRQRTFTRKYSQTVTLRDPPGSVLNQLQEKLAFLNGEGTVVTFDPVQKDWVEWIRLVSLKCHISIDDLDATNSPWITHNDGTMSNLNAVEFGCASADMSPVLCPHILNPLQSVEECIMTLHTGADQPTNYFQAENDIHTCDFKGMDYFSLF